MFFSFIVASIIPFLMWLIQKALGKTSKKATYIRRRIFVLVSMVLFLLSVLGWIALLNKSSDSSAVVFGFMRSVLYWVGFFVLGTTKIDGNRPYLYSLWEAYDPSYVKPKKKLPPLGTNKN